MRTDVLGVGFDDVTMDEAVGRAMEMIAGRTGAYVVTPNPEIVWLCRSNSSLLESVCGAELVLADGVGITLGAKMLGRPLKTRLPGIDFATCLMRKLSLNGTETDLNDTGTGLNGAAIGPGEAERGRNGTGMNLETTGKGRDGYSIFLYGAKPGVAERAGLVLEKNYPSLRIVGAMDGYGDEGLVRAAILEAEPDLLLVCLGAPKQELWMAAYAGRLPVGLMIGLGGALDVFAGEVQRAPERWRRLGLEWLYRLCKEPRRARRMLRLPLFLLAVVGQRLRGK
ncbi:MAG: WecB/TagA/CpsF family glycosyltransferase [Oscillospiraceae bacterium]|nr:WecB/TagA/CpsF family glycosyltransferase [Oscillospiraceae bacterium]